jgi:hypothetical protein
MIPLQVCALLDEPLLWEGPAELIGQVVCGICGLLALRFVLTRLLTGAQSPIKYPGVLWVGVLLGLLPILDIAIRGSAGWKIFAAAPLLATLPRDELGRAPSELAAPLQSRVHEARAAQVQSGPRRAVGHRRRLHDPARRARRRDPGS